MLMSEATSLQGWLLLTEHQAKLPLQDWGHYAQIKDLETALGLRKEKSWHMCDLQTQADVLCGSYYFFLIM